MNIGAIAFGVVCLACVLGGVVYVAAVSNAQPMYSDTYGNTYTATTNSSIGMVSNVTSSTGTSVSVWLILLAVATAVCAVVTIFYVASKNW